MNCALLGYNPFSGADNYNSEWEYIIANYTFSLEEVAELFKKGSITVDEYMYAVDYLKT